MGLNRFAVGAHASGFYGLRVWPWSYAPAPCSPPSPAPTTDDELLKSLKARSGEDYDRELLGEKPRAPAPGGGEAQKLQARLRRELGTAAAAEDDAQNPLVGIARQMHEVQQRMGRHDAGTETQFRQRQIVADLEKLIEQAKRSGQCQSGSPPQGVASRPPSDSPTTRPKASRGSRIGPAIIQRSKAIPTSSIRPTASASKRPARRAASCSS